MKRRQHWKGRRRPQPPRDTEQFDNETDFGIPIPGEVLPPEQWAKTAIKRLPPPGPLDWQSVFGRIAPIILDLGCGNGRFLIGEALRHPERDFLGVDILPLVVRYATKRSNQRGLHNARLAVIGAFELLEQYVAPATISEIHLYHPQPYKDSERAYKRLITPEFLAIARRSLVSGGMLVLQTDNREYWKYIRRVAPLLFEFTESCEPWPESPHGRTRREIYARQHGMPIFRGQGVPRTDLSDEQIAEIIQTQAPPRFDA
jgi:tRNA (guanine-N7-)-methyltransferase